jgi:hypothetical protein
MKIVVGGYIVGYPLGGMTWHHLNYLLGLVELGHDVVYLEDGAYLSPFDPTTGLNGDATFGLDYLRQTFDHYRLRIPFHYRFGSVSAGLSSDEIQDRLKQADLFIAVSGITPTSWYAMPRRTLVIDTDPVFTQLRMQADGDFAAYFKSFTHAATFGRLIADDSKRPADLPTGGVDWIPTQQPVSLHHWPMMSPRHGAVLSTVGKWEHASDRVVKLGDRSILSNKSVEYDKLLNLPARAGVTIEMRMASMPAEVATRYEQHGWRLADAYEATRTCRSYHDYIHRSLGEFTVVKQLYSAVPSGWFSDRSACFLATGRPVITQRSGFEQWLPTGEGLLAFDTLDEAADAVRRVVADPRRHSSAARGIAERYFDARVVLSNLLEHVA